MTDSTLRRSLAGTISRLALFATLAQLTVGSNTAGAAMGAMAATGAQSAPPGGPAKQAGAGEPQARLIALSVLPARTSRAGSPPSGALLAADERATAAANGIEGPADGAYFPAQPVQGISSLIPAENGAWWALADNGYAWRGNSADWQLVIYRIAPRWREKAGAQLLETVTLRDPDRRIPWTIVCDPGHGDALPGISFNRLPQPPPFCNGDTQARPLTGFDFDPESFVRAPDDSFWVSEEFGPFLLHFSPDGKLLEAPIPVPGVRSPQNPYLDLADRSRPERPTLAASRGFEGLAISPDGRTLYALLEGAVAGDDARDLRIYVYRMSARKFDDAFLRVRLEAPSQQVDLTRIVDERGERLYPAAVAPPSGPVSIGELKAVNAHQLLMIERDNLGDDERSPRFKKVFLLDLGEGGGAYVRKSLLLDLLALPDPAGVGGDGDFFRLPFYTIESVYPVDERTLAIASDNNFPFSNGRARSRNENRKGPLAADDSELVLVRVGTPLEVDSRLLPKLVGKGRP